MGVSGTLEEGVSRDEGKDLFLKKKGFLDKSASVQFGRGNIAVIIKTRRKEVCPGGHVWICVLYRSLCTTGKNFLYRLKEGIFFLSLFYFLRRLMTVYYFTSLFNITEGSKNLYM